MPSYRFCRSDDIPLLIDAHNECFLPDFPERPRWDLLRYRALAKEIDLWTSSCMVTLEEGKPVGVMLATKRESEMLVVAVGVKPEFRRLEHGRHMLRSLSAKLAILGPPRMTAELPAEALAARSFFEACDWSFEEEYEDLVREDPVFESALSSPLIQPLRIEDLESMPAWASALDASVPCWEYSRRTLQNRRDQIRGWGIPSFDGWAAWLLHDRSPETGDRRILALGTSDAERGEAMQALLVRYFCEREAPDRIRFPGVRVRSRLHGSLLDRGFRPKSRQVRYVSIPRPA